MRHSNSNPEDSRVRGASSRTRPRLAPRTVLGKAEAFVVRFLALAVFAAVLQTSAAQAQVALDANSGAQTPSSSSSITWTHTVGGSSSNLVLLAVVTISGGSSIVTNVTWGSSSLSCLFAISVTGSGSSTGSCNNAGSSASRRAEIWGAPVGTPSTKGQTVTVTLSSSASVVAGSASFKNASQAGATNGSFGTGEGTAGTNSPASLSFSSLPANGAVMDDIAISYQQPITGLGGTQQSLWSAANGSNVYGSSSYETGAVTSMSQIWTGGSTHWAYVAVPINPAPPAARRGQTIVGQLLPLNVGNLWW